MILCVFVYRLSQLSGISFLSELEKLPQESLLGALQEERRNYKTKKELNIGMYLEVVEWAIFHASELMRSKILLALGSSDYLLKYAQVLIDLEAGAFLSSLKEAQEVLFLLWQSKSLLEFQRLSFKINECRLSKNRRPSVKKEELLRLPKPPNLQLLTFSHAVEGVLGPSDKASDEEETLAILGLFISEEARLQQGELDFEREAFVIIHERLVDLIARKAYSEAITEILALLETSKISCVHCVNEEIEVLMDHASAEQVVRMVHSFYRHTPNLIIQKIINKIPVWDSMAVYRIVHSIKGVVLQKYQMNLYNALRKKGLGDEVIFSPSGALIKGHLIPELVQKSEKVRAA